nr:M56 family metallopeptidase [Methylomarinum sp. Ch1-1]MDP4519522.1 M56 family metallopeptidase [Methylomarinum sp. Ch1-1]
MHFLQSGILATFFFGGLLSLLSAIGYPGFRRHLLALPCHFRSKLLVMGLCAPLILGILVTLFGLLPSWMVDHDEATEHCATHANGMAHLCWFDPLVHLSDHFWTIGAGLMACVVGYGMIAALLFCLRNRRFQATLNLISKYDAEHRVYRIDSERSFVFSAGLFAPRAFISSQLIEQLSSPHLAVVLAHEQSHCRRRDVLWRQCLRITGLLHFSPTRRLMLEDLELAQEQICDTEAAQRVGDRLLVAETLIKIVRQHSVSLPEAHPAISAFNGSHIELRIRQLLEQPEPLPPRWPG